MQISGFEYIRKYREHTLRDRYIVGSQLYRMISKYHDG